MESKFFIALSMFVLITRLSAQPYPVDAFVRMHPPFSPYLEDWGTALHSPLSLQLLLKDATAQQYPVRLRMSWLGQGIKISTLVDFQRPPILLDYGLALELNGSDLSGYLDWNNLDVQGIDRNMLYQNGGRLPEGMYNFCVEVLDARRPYEAPLSNQACAVIQLEIFPPPEILAPTDEAMISQFPVQFQWIPQHVGSFPVEYTFRLYKNQEGMNPAQIVNHTLPYLEVSTQNRTQFLYDWDDPPLETGSTYLVQVEVEDLTGNHQFQANGKSQVYSFLYDDQPSANCQLGLPSLQVQQQDSQTLGLSWLQVANAQGYEIQLSTKDSFLENTSTYYTHSVTDTFVNFSGLLSQTSYYCRVRATAGECFSDYSNKGPIRLHNRCRPAEATDTILYACGQADQEIQLNTSASSWHLEAGDSIWAHQFPIVVTEVMGNGPFSGSGHGHLAYLQYAQVNVKLQQIEIDAHCRLISGKLVVTGSGLNILDPSALELLNDVLKGLDALDQALAGSEAVLSAIDQFIQELETYLPQEIIDQLILAQQAANAAQQAYEAALASGNAQEIEAAKIALDLALDQLKEALQNYKEALLLFLRTWLEVAGAIFADLLEDCLWDQVKTAYQQAKATLGTFISNDTEAALNELPAFAGNSLELREESEWIVIEAADTMSVSTFDQLTSTFYQKEMDYLLCHTLDQLQKDIQSTEDIAVFQQLLAEVNSSSLEMISEGIRLGTAIDELVQAVKQLLYEDIQQLIQRSSYPSAVTLSSN